MFNVCCVKSRLSDAIALALGFEQDADDGELTLDLLDQGRSQFQRVAPASVLRTE